MIYLLLISFCRTAMTSDETILIAEPKGLSHSKCKDAKSNFYHFVQTVYNRLYKMESRVNGGKSPLSVFCRFDIGLIQNANKEVWIRCNRLILVADVQS